MKYYPEYLNNFFSDHQNTTKKLSNKMMYLHTLYIKKKTLRKFSYINTLSATSSFLSVLIYNC